MLSIGGFTIRHRFWTFGIWNHSQRSSYGNRATIFNFRSKMTLIGNQKIHLILDFDGTIVKNNTIPLLDHLRQEKSTVQYSSFLEPYMKDYTSHSASYQPAKTDRKTLQQEYDYLDSLSHVERSSIERVEASGWLKGLEWNSKDSIAFDRVARQLRTTKELTWRSGFVDLVEAVWQHNGKVDILSVNWSSQFIRSLIKEEFGNQIDVSRIRIFSNEIDPRGTGRFSRVKCIREEEVGLFWPEPETEDYTQSRGIWTSNDKAKIMNSIGHSSRAEGTSVVYAGDSKTDLRCLMDADIGIYLRDDEDPSEEQTGLMEVLNRIGIEQKPIDQRISVKGISDHSVNTLWYAEDFSAMHKALFQIVS